jgi:hypothetical protein
MMVSPRIVADTDSNGAAELWFLDRDGKVRIGANTDSNGLPTLSPTDRNEKPRIIASIVPDGASYIGVFDSTGHQTWAEKSK